MQLDTDEEENFWTFPDALHISPQDSITVFRLLAAFLGRCWVCHPTTTPSTVVVLWIGAFSQQIAGDSSPQHQCLVSLHKCCSGPFVLALQGKTSLFIWFALLYLVWFACLIFLWMFERRQTCIMLRSASSQTAASKGSFALSRDPGGLQITLSFL